LAVCWGCDCCAWRPTSLLFPADLGSSSTVGLSPVSSRGPRPRTGAEVSPTHESCWRMRLEPSTRHLSSSRQERGLDYSDPGLIATYRRYRRLRQEFAERSLVAPQFSCLGDLAGAVWKYQDVVHVQDLSAALSGAAKQRNRVVVVSQDMVEFHSIVPSKARTLCWTERDVGMSPGLWDSGGDLAAVRDDGTPSGRVAANRALRHEAW
jgi:hypothetical protein